MLQHVMAIERPHEFTYVHVTWPCPTSSELVHDHYQTQTKSVLLGAFHCALQSR